MMPSTLVIPDSRYKVRWLSPEEKDRIILDLSRELERAQQRIAGLEERLQQHAPAALPAPQPAPAAAAEPAPAAAVPASGSAPAVVSPAPRSDPWRVDESTEAYLRSLLDRYSAGLTAVLPGEPERLLPPELLLNDGLDLESADHPLVLSLIASCDPVSPVALGATARMMPRIDTLPRGRKIAKLLRQVARHHDVRESIGIALDGTFSSPAMNGLRWFIEQAIREDRERARQEMIDYLNALRQDRFVPPSVVADLLSLTHRIGLGHQTLKRLLVNIVESSQIRTAAKLQVVADIDKLRADLRIEIALRIGHLPETPGNLALKRAARIMLLRSYPGIDAARAAAAGELQVRSGAADPRRGGPAGRRPLPQPAQARPWVPPSLEMVLLRRTDTELQ